MKKRAKKKPTKKLPLIVDMRCPVCKNDLWFELHVYGAERAIVRGNFSDWTIELRCNDTEHVTKSGARRQNACGFRTRVRFELVPGGIAFLATAVLDLEAWARSMHVDGGLTDGKRFTVNLGTGKRGVTSYARTDGVFSRLRR